MLIHKEFKILKCVLSENWHLDQNEKHNEFRSESWAAELFKTDLKNAIWKMGLH